MFDLFFFYQPHKDPRIRARNYAFMDLMRASAQRVGFTGKFVFYTHEKADLPNDLPVTEVVRVAPEGVAQGEIMLLKSFALHHFLTSALFERPTISVEADQLFQRDPAEAFELGFDVGLTYPCWTKEISGDFGKLNGGVVYLNSKNIEATRDYFSGHIKKYLEIKDEVDRRFTREINGE